jgi:hypothetical protein
VAVAVTSARGAERYANLPWAVGVGRERAPRAATAIVVLHAIDMAITVSNNHLRR